MTTYSECACPNRCSRDRQGSAPLLLPCGRRPREARSYEGCSRERQRLTPLEHPSSVSALRADPPSPTRGEGKRLKQKRTENETVPP
ncbi:MAG: hypothetical protein E5Y12_18390 [Mesorhizobium sp.]|nr:MAG: hypothetical protein E5Y12_18390 [Mesorhizobium sp.]